MLPVLFQTKQYLLLPSIQFLCLLDTKFPFDQALPYIEVTSDLDMERFKALKEGRDQLISVLQSFQENVVGLKSSYVDSEFKFSSCKVFEYYIISTVYFAVT
jgi:hypothetical protein